MNPIRLCFSVLSLMAAVAAAPPPSRKVLRKLPRGAHSAHRHVRLSPKESGPWAVSTGISQSDILPSLWALATPSLRRWLECPESSLYSLAHHKAANSSGTLTWQPRGDRYLLLECHLGTLPHRMRCFRNHILLAGLLNRTLLLPDFKQGAPLKGVYSWDLIFTLSDVHACFGNTSLIPLRYYTRARKEDNVRVNNLFLWSDNPEAAPVRKGDLELVLPAAHSAGLRSDSTLKDWLGAYGSIRAEVLIVGDLSFAFGSIPDAAQLQQVGDAPFVRLPSCLSPFFLRPAKGVLRLVQQFRKRFLRHPSYVAVHWVRGSTPAVNCSGGAGGEGGAPSVVDGGEGSFSERARDQEREGGEEGEEPRRRRVLAEGGDSDVNSGMNSLCAVGLADVAGAIWRALASTKAAKNVFLVTDATPEEVTALKLQLFMVENRVIRVRTSATLLARILAAYPKHIRQAQDLVERIICAQADIFLGTHGTVFSLEVQRMRYGVGKATCRDQALSDVYLGGARGVEKNVSVDLGFLNMKHSGW